MEASQKNAIAVANFLDGHPSIEKVTEANLLYRFKVFMVIVRRRLGLLSRLKELPSIRADAEAGRRSRGNGVHLDQRRSPCRRGLPFQAQGKRNLSLVDNNIYDEILLGCSFAGVRSRSVPGSCGVSGVQSRHYDPHCCRES